jgi:hypothetical protein
MWLSVPTLTIGGRSFFDVPSTTHTGEAMKQLVTVVLLGALLPWVPLAGAQSSRLAPGASVAQAERNAVELKQGMSAEEVERLLGKPRRTALKSNDSSSGALSQGTLQWTYSWSSTSTAAILHVKFAAKTPEAWFVSSWEWGSY